VSDLSDLAEQLTKDLPANVRKVVDTALANGWELNKPGMTVALRLNHPTDELAQPVYVTWYVGRTPKGALSFKFSSCGTQGLVPLSGGDLLEYLADPTVIYPTDDDLEAKGKEQEDKDWEKKTPKWDDSLGAVQNVTNQLHGQMIRLENVTAAELMKEQRARIAAMEDRPSSSTPGKTDGSQAQPLRVSALRIQAPKA
jgi:hypothetical protein